MPENLSVQISLPIHCDQAIVWDAITDPASLKLMMFGCDVITNWVPGQPIFFRGNWNGTSFEDKGTILSYKEGRYYSYDYWSGFSGLEDIPENYSIIRFELFLDGNCTILKLTQEKLHTELSRDHSEKNWQETLHELKSRLENL